MKRSSQQPGIANPAELSAALATNASARAVFESLPPSHQREYAQYVADARQSKTRTRRAARTIEMLGQKQPEPKRAPGRIAVTPATR